MSREGNNNYPEQIVPTDNPAEQAEIVRRHANFIPQSDQERLLAFDIISVIQSGDSSNTRFGADRYLVFRTNGSERVERSVAREIIDYLRQAKSGLKDLGMSKQDLIRARDPIRGQEPKRDGIFRYWFWYDQALDLRKHFTDNPEIRSELINEMSSEW